MGEEAPKGLCIRGADLPTCCEPAFVIYPSAKNDSEAQIPRPSSDSTFPRYRGRHPGDTREEGGRRGRKPRRGSASAERMLRATREARCDLPACSNQKDGLRRPQPLGGWF